MDLAIDIEDVRFAYRSAKPILQIDTLQIGQSEQVFLHGPSGCGKTTLLGLIAGIQLPQSGSVSVLGTNLSKLSGSARDAFRGLHIGYIFQLFNLIPYLTVQQNITLPLRLHPHRKSRLQTNTMEDEVRRLADYLGLGNLLRQNVVELSVGQQQRVAAARALIGSPEIVIADEPTSSLDSVHRARFIELLLTTCRTAGSTLVFVSHDQSLMNSFDRCASLPDINRITQGETA